MGLVELGSFLTRHRRLALDTSIFIYSVESNPQYGSSAYAIFEWIGRPGITAITSTITMTELLVHPYREEDQPRVDDYYGLFSIYPNLLWVPPDLKIADLAARLRARYRLRTIDALQAATALRSKASGFVTNDFKFKQVTELETLVLDDVL